MPALRALIGSRHKVLSVLAQPDRKSGRGLKISPPPTRVLAQSRDIEVFQPDNVSDEKSVAYLKKFNADIFVVISFGQMLKKEVLEIPRLYALNVHGSLLPEYRGASPTNWAVINGDKKSGITIISMNEKMDEGDVVASKEVPIEDNDTNITLSEKLSEEGARLLLYVLDGIDAGKTPYFQKQDSSKATYAPKLKKNDGLIDWNDTSAVIRNKVRGMVPWPTAFTYYEGRLLKLLRVKVPDKPYAQNAQPGEVLHLDKEGIVVRTGSGDIVIEFLQLEGKKCMDAASFARGHRIKIGYIFETKK